MDINFIILYTIKIFIIIDPIGMFPIILDQITKSSPTYEGRKSFIRRELFIAGIIALTTLVLGRSIFFMLDIPLKVIKVAGGALLVIIGINMTGNEEEKETKIEKEELELQSEEKNIIFPVATPIIAGPGTMSLLMIIRESASSFLDAFTTAAIGVTTCLITIYVLFLVSSRFSDSILKTASYFAAVITIIFGVAMVGEGLHT